MLVVAWVRMWTSSPIWKALGGERENVDRPAAFNAVASVGAATSRRNRSRSIAASGLSPEPGHVPWPLVDGAEGPVPPAWFSTTRTGADGPSAVAIGTTVAWWLAGSSRTCRSRSRRPASATSAAQPSADRRGPHRAPQRVAHVRATAMAGPQCSSVRSAEAGHNVAGRGRLRPAAGHRCRAGGAPRRWPRRSGAPDRRGAWSESGDQLRVAAGRDPPVDVWSTGRPCGGHRIGKEGQADVDHGDVVGKDGTLGAPGGEGGIICPMGEAASQWATEMSRPGSAGRPR